MPEDAERVKRLVEFKKKLEHRIEELSSDLKDSQAMLETLNSLLIEKGFKRLEVNKKSVKAEHTSSEEQLHEAGYGSQYPQSMGEHEDATPLQNIAGELLANLYVEGNTLRVVPAEDKNFNFTTPPFTQFFIERILQKMQERDSQLVRAGQLSSENILRYTVAQEGDIIREITIKNIDSDRLKELKSSIRWTLEKMYEKMRSQT